MSLEARTKLHIQDEIRDGKLELVTSYMLWYEISKNPFPVKRSLIGGFIEEYTSVFVEGDEDGSIRETARQVMGTGVKSMDAYHVACAIHAGCDYLVTTDRRLLKYGDARIKLENPVDFVAETEA